MKNNKLSNILNVLALDLESTLISTAVSQIPRPGLFSFLKEVHRLFNRIVIFTAVDEVKFRQIARRLVFDKFAPDWFVNLEYIHWHGKVKDLSFIENAQIDDIIIVDDMEIYIHPNQKCHWLKIKCFEYPYSDEDCELVDVLANIRSRVNEN
jgi:hypothetical protein